MRDLDLSQYVEADRREVDPPIEVEAATWSLAARSTGGSKSAGSDWEGFAVQTDASGGSKQLIFVRKRTASRLTGPCR